MRKFDLNALKNQFKAPTNEGGSNGGSSFYPFWNMEVGESATVRFLPDLNPDNPLGFLLPKLTHTLFINGAKQTVPCPKTWDKNADCPICKASAAFYKADDKVNGKKYWRSKVYLGQALIVEDPLQPNKETGETYVGKIVPLQLGTKIYDAIQEEFEAGTFSEVPFDYEEGTNFIIKKTKSGEWADYARSRFDRKPSALDEPTIELVEESLVELSTLLPAKPDVARLQALLDAALNGAPIDDAPEGEDGEDDTPVTQVTTAKAAAATATKKPKTPVDVPPVADNDDAGDDDEEALRILAQLNARRKQNAA